MRVNQGSNSAAGISSADVKSANSQKTDKTKKTGYEGSVESKKDSASSSSVKAEISTQAKDMAKAKQLAMEAPDVRENKIAELRERIAAGKYQVDSKAVADKLVDDHMSMPGA